jgi:hypothetical protein
MLHMLMLIMDMLLMPMLLTTLRHLACASKGRFNELLIRELAKIEQD